MQNRIVQKKELADVLEVKIRQIGNYIKRGMPISSTGKRGVQNFETEICKNWKVKNIDKVMSTKTKLYKQSKSTEIEIEIDEKNTDEDEEVKCDLERKLKADADSAVIKVKLDNLKLAEAEGRVVDANDLDKSMSELAIVHKTDKINDENVLPILLANKTASEIKKQLQKFNTKRLEELDKLINREFKSVETLYDIVEVVLCQLKEGIEPESLIKRIKGSLI